MRFKVYVRITYDIVAKSHIGEQMKIIMYATIESVSWKEVFRTEGIKGIEGISGLYAQVPDGKGDFTDIKDAILCQAWPFRMNMCEGENAEETIVQFAKDPKEIYVDWGDRSSADAEGILPENALTYEHLNIEEFIKRDDPLYCSWVKEIKPEEILGVFKSTFIGGMKEGDRDVYLINGEDATVWQEKQLKVIKENR